MRYIIIVVSLVLSSAGIAIAQNTPKRVPRVAVVIGIAVNLEQAQADQLGGALAAALTKQLKVDTIGGAEVTRRLPAGGIEEECPGKPACIADIGSRTQADQILFLSIVKVGTAHQIDATWTEIATGKRASRPALQLADVADADKIFVENAARYLPDAEPRETKPNIIYNNNNVTNEPERPIKPVVLVVGGGGVLAMIGSGVLGLSVKSKYDGCKDAPCSPSEKDAIDKRALIADITLGVGIAAVATAAILYFTTPLEESAPVPTVEPVAGGAVIGLEGRW
jgi:hypothetical protein